MRPLQPPASPGDSHARGFIAAVTTTQNHTRLPATARVPGDVLPCPLDVRFTIETTMAVSGCPDASTIDRLPHARLETTDHRLDGVAVTASRFTSAATTDNRTRGGILMTPGGAGGYLVRRVRRLTMETSTSAAIALAFPARRVSIRIHS